MRQFGRRCHERGRAAIKADINSRKYKDSYFVRVPEVMRQVDVHLGGILCLVATTAHRARQWGPLNPAILLICRSEITQFLE